MSVTVHDHKYFMKKAIHQAKRAAALGEVPIGCVIVCDGKVIGRGFNRRLSSHSTLAHAEIIAIRQACKKLGDWRLEGCTMYVTLEPCQMCSGACVQSRIDRVVIGAENPKAGCAGSIVNLLQMSEFNHRVDIVRDVCTDECSALLSDFFRDMRTRERENKAAKAAD
ncbi:MAG: tRNA adenosine(34) deaminase TadA [Lachnospiraceae bacterium]|nr:tRNA adenosine(34) deaminase TadA [Lachnospiraceae bacterium]